MEEKFAAQVEFFFNNTKCSLKRKTRSSIDPNVKEVKKEIL